MATDQVIPADEQLVARLRRHDEETFTLLVDAWSPGMLRLARTFVSTSASAEDVVQEAWLGVLKGLHTFAGRASLKTWVFRILVNIAKTRGAVESRTVPVAEPLPEDRDPVVDPARFRGAGDPYPGHWRDERAPRPLPEDLALAGEARKVIAEAVARLPARHRIVITLRDMEGYRAEEVCSILEITPGNQRVLLHRARAVVRRHLEEYFSADGEAS